MKSNKFNAVSFIILFLLTALIVGYGVYLFLNADIVSKEVDSLKVTSSDYSYKSIETKQVVVNEDFRGLYITADDICADNPTEQQVALRCNSIVNEVLQLGFTSIILDTKRATNNDFIYKSDYVGFCGVDALATIISAAKHEGIGVFPIFYLNETVLPNGLNTDEIIEYQQNAFKEFTEKYDSKGYILKDISLEQTGDIYYRYKNQVSEVTIEEYITDLNVQRISKLVSHTADKQVGMVVDLKGLSGKKAEKILDSKYLEEQQLIAKKIIDFVVYDTTELKKYTAYSTAIERWNDKHGGINIESVLVHNADSVLADNEGNVDYSELIKRIKFAGGFRFKYGYAFKNYSTLLNDVEKSNELLGMYS